MMMMINRYQQNQKIINMHDIRLIEPIHQSIIAIVIVITKNLPVH